LRYFSVLLNFFFASRSNKRFPRVSPHFPAKYRLQKEESTVIPRAIVEVHPGTLFSLMSQLRTANSPLNLDEAVNQAILNWLEKASQPPVPAQDAAPEAPTIRGYHWKTLFLPEGTRLRIAAHPEHPEARVVGDDIECRGGRISPNAYVQACPGAHRNAWELIHVLVPGARHWKRADLLRRALPAELKAEQPPAPKSSPALHRVGERRAWNVGGRRETDGMPEPVFTDH
jgi:hypothetical protein